MFIFKKKKKNLFLTSSICSKLQFLFSPWIDGLLGLRYLQDRGRTCSQCGVKEPHLDLLHIPKAHIREGSLQHREEQARPWLGQIGSEFPLPPAEAWVKQEVSLSH